MESVDYTDSDYRYEIEGDNAGRNYGNESFEANGFSQGQLDENGDIVAEEDQSDDFDTEEGFDDFEE